MEGQTNSGAISPKALTNGVVPVKPLIPVASAVQNQP